MLYILQQNIRERILLQNAIQKQLRNMVDLRWHAIQMNFVLPNVSVDVGETIAEEEEGGWQPISAISLQQSFALWQISSQ